MLLLNLKAHKGIRQHFVFKFLRLSIEVVIVAFVKYMEHVLGCWYKLLSAG